jgi:hypothetical protein
MTFFVCGLVCAASSVPAQVQSDFEELTRGWNATAKINDVSPMSVFGPSAFPVVASSPSLVAMTGARVGKGRLIAAGVVKTLDYNTHTDT